MSATFELLNRWLDSVGQALKVEAVRRLLELRADDQTQQPEDELADRYTEGQLTADERAEYEAIVAGGEIVTVLQAKARAKIATGTSAA
jgi:hypothetical protein